MFGAELFTGLDWLLFPLLMVALCFIMCFLVGRGKRHFMPCCGGSHEHNIESGRNSDVTHQRRNH
jgi:hypothetical protein